MKKLIKAIPKAALPIVLCVLMAVVLVYAISIRVNAASFGGGIGQNIGSVTGKAVGSAEGIIDGLAAPVEPEIPEVIIANHMQQVEKLEVLAASVKLSDFHTIGRNDNINYAALYLVNGTVVFTVNLCEAVVVPQGDELHIILPAPGGTLYLDDSTVEKLAEYQTSLFNGSAEVGFDAYLQSMARVHEATEETLANYDSLIAAAKAAAENQIALLVKAASFTYKDVIVEWTN